MVVFSQTAVDCFVDHPNNGGASVVVLGTAPSSCSDACVQYSPVMEAVRVTSKDQILTSKSISFKS